MDAIVEVETARAAARAIPVLVQVICHAYVLIVALSGRFSTSTIRRISQGSHSISAVAPDAHNFSRGLTAVA